MQKMAWDFGRDPVCLRIEDTFGKKTSENETSAQFLDCHLIITYNRPNKVSNDSTKPVRKSNPMSFSSQRYPLSLSK